MALIEVGDLAPDFTLQNQKGEPFTLSSSFGKKHTVLYFYPKNETMICTKEACTFRDQYEDFIEAGAEVVGVSSDSIESHKMFAERRKLPFVLLSDPAFVAHKLYGAEPSLFGLWKARVTYLIDKDGIVRNVFNARFEGPKHVTEALQALGKFEKASL